jgi:hypothetical protein
MQAMASRARVTKNKSNALRSAAKAVLSDTVPLVVAMLVRAVVAEDTALVANDRATSQVDIVDIPPNRRVLFASIISHVCDGHFTLHNL